MRIHPDWFGTAIATLVLAAGLGMRAQTTGGSIQGTVVDSSGQPIIGALIQVTGPSLQGYQGAATDTTGQYVIPYLPPGKDYQVKVEAQGFSTVVRKDITVPLGATVSLPFTLSQGKTQIVVTAAAPIIDLKSNQIGATLSSQMIQAIPLQRDSSQIVFLAPTAVNSGSSTPGMASIGGSTGAENTYLVNGMDVTNTDLGTGTGATMGNGMQVVAGASTGSMLNFDFIQDMQVMTGGVSPEYGNGMGGIVNAITQSGGNEYHGSLYAYYWSDKLQAKSKTYSYVPTVFGNDGYQRYDLGGDLGGYFVKDKVWFYLGYDYNRMKDYTVVPGGPGFGDQYLYLNGQPAESAFVGQRITDASEINQQYAFKVTWNVNPSQKLSLTTFGNQDKLDQLGTLATLAASSQPYESKTQPTNVSLQWNATWTPKFFTEAVASYHDSTQKWSLRPQAQDNWSYSYYFSQGVYGGFDALPANQSIAPAGATDPNTLITDLGGNYQPSLGFGGYSPIDKDSSSQFRVKFTNLLGHHELSYGFQYDDRKYTPIFGLSGSTNWVSPATHTPAIGGLFVQWAPASYFGFPTGPNGQQFVYYAQDYFIPQARPAAERSQALWVNDNWSLTNYFTLKLGLRYDEQKVEGKLPGSESVDLKNNYAPRLGFTWDVAHNAKSKLFGFAGRYFQRMPTDMAVRSLNNEQSGFEYFYDPSLTTWTGTSFIIGGTEDIQGQTPGLPVNAALKAPYSDEYILGFDYEVRPDLRLGVRGIYRTLGRAIEDFSFNGAQTYIIGNPDKWTGVPVPGLNPDYSPNYNQIYYFPKPVRIYRALELSANKRFSNRWQLGGSYVLSRLEGNYEGLSSNDTTAGQLDPGINATYDLPQFLVNGYGMLPLDRTHVLKLYGGYAFSNIPLQLSASFGLQSGTPISKQIQVSWYGGAVGFANTRGANGRTPTTWALDLAGQYDFHLSKRWGQLGLRLDLFNVTNEQRTTAVYQTWQVQTGPGAPLQMDNTYWSKPYQHQAPRLLRLGIRWTF